MNLSWINDLINSHINMYYNLESKSDIGPVEFSNKIEALELFREDIKRFIKDSNQLTEEGNRNEN